MKSKVKLLGALAISAISVLSYVQISHSEKLDDLLLENIEALAAGESGDDSKCFRSDSSSAGKEGVSNCYLQVDEMLTHIGVLGVNFFSRPNFGRFPNKDWQKPK